MEKSELWRRGRELRGELVGVDVSDQLREAFASAGIDIPAGVYPSARAFKQRLGGWGIVLSLECREHVESAPVPQALQSATQRPADENGFRAIMAEILEHGIADAVFRASESQIRYWRKVGSPAAELESLIFK